MADAQFAFVGTVTGVSAEVLPWTTDPENPDRTDDPAATPWVSFEVDRWYTVDWGSNFAVWMPDRSVEVGSRVAVGGDAHYATVGDFSGQSGSVEFCVAVVASDALTSWDAFFGGSVVAGSGRPEGEPDPATVVALEQARQEWAAAAPDSYSFVVSGWDRDTVLFCGRSNSVRVVVIDGAPTEAIGTDDGCRADPDAIATVDEVFARAIELAGATSFDFSVDPQGPEPIAFDASDRSVESSMRVIDVSENTAPAVVGWDDVTRSAQQHRQTWTSSPLDHVLRIRTGGGERSRFDVDAVIVDGVVVELVVNDEPADPQSARSVWEPVTVEDVFELIGELEGQGNVVAVFDPATGAPIDLSFDPSPSGIDDELKLSVDVTPL